MQRQLRLRVRGSGGARHDVAVSHEKGVLVRDVAHALIRRFPEEATAADPEISHRRGTLTLIGQSVDGDALEMLDPGAPVEHSGVQSGWEVSVIREFATAVASATRVTPILGVAEVLDGAGRGDRFSLVAGANSVGRGAHNRIRLSDRSVSRRHCVIDVGDRAVIRDLASVNGVIADGVPVPSVAVPAQGTREVRIGDVGLRIRIDALGHVPSAVEGTAAVPPRSTHEAHTPPPRVVPRFAATERVLPKPPARPAPARVPLATMIAPAVLGIAMWFVTESVTSLVFAALSPVLAGAAWGIERVSRRAGERHEGARFQTAIAFDRQELAAAQKREVVARSSAAPATPEILRAVQYRTRVLWTRRVEHDTFLVVRLGTGRAASRTRLTVPEDGSAAERAQLNALVSDFAYIEPVPIVERLTEAGAVAVCGLGEETLGAARALIMQLVGLHSPADLQLAAFADAATGLDWAWLGWLPHADAAASGLGVTHLVDDAAGASALISALEKELSRRADAERTKSPILVVLVLSDAHVARARLLRIAEHGPDVGIHSVWVVRHSSDAPAACRTYVECDSASGRVGSVRTGNTVPLRSVESVDADAAERTARRMAPLFDAGAPPAMSEGLPATVELRDLHEVDLTAGAEAILRGWRATESVRADWHPGRHRNPSPLTATLGQGAGGPLQIDLRADGPHALVGGTTGSGKSDFLQTWIMSLAASLSPEQVTFLLFDFKGGAAFAACASLPHTVGLVTDLSADLVHRALTSLRAELRYREALLAEAGAKDLLSLERVSHTAAPPALVIVIDEFAALASEEPEFVDGVVDIAQRGRSLGLHLIMSTQRPAGVITDNLRANTRIRIALRMADERESRDVIGTTHAAEIPLTAPGRGAVRFGTDAPVLFQTGRLGGAGQSRRARATVSVTGLGFGEREAPGSAVTAESENRPDRVAELERLRLAIGGAAEAAAVPAPRRPWLDPLPRVLLLDEVPPSPPERRAGAVVIGLVDLPERQLQPVLSIDFPAVGHVAIIGAGGTGKTSAVVMMACELARASSPKHPIEIYAIDAAGGELECLSPLPMTAAVASISNMELVTRIIDRLHSLLDTPCNGRVSAVLILEGLSAFREATESTAVSTPLYARFAELVARGRAAGVHVVLTTDRPAAIPAALAAHLEMRLALRLVSESDQALLGLRVGGLDDAPPGRGFILGSHTTFQLALLASPEERRGLRQVVARCAQDLECSGHRRVPRLRNAPRRISLAALPVTLDEAPVIGIETAGLSPVTMPTRGLCLVVGPPSSGLTTALRTCVTAWTRWSSKCGSTAETVLLSFGRSGLSGACAWNRTAVGAVAVLPVVEELLAALDGAAREQPEPTCSRSALRTLIVVERSAECDDERVLSRLAALVGAIKRSDMVMLVESDPSAAPYPFGAAIRHPRWGISLKPDPADGSGPFRESLPRRARDEDPPGRGLLIRTGRVSEVQIADPSEVWEAMGAEG